MIAYILKSGLCLAICYVFYKLILEKEKNHHMKRFFLLGILMLSFGIPLITFTTYVEVAPQESVVFSQEVMPFDSKNDITIPTFEKDYTPTILWSIYIFGVFLFGIQFIYNLSRIYVRIKQNPTKQHQNFTHVLLQEMVAPHTFFNYIFFNKNKYELKGIPNEVHLHEQAHARQKHSLDILFIELLKVVFWFNPIIYLLKHAVKLNHEFLADQAVLNDGIPTKTYQQTLLTFTADKEEFPLANALNYSSIKKRFTVMKTPTSKNKLFLKSLLILPLIAVLLVAFSRKESVEIEVATTSLSNHESSKYIDTFEEPQNKQETSAIAEASEEMIAEYISLAKGLNTQPKNYPIKAKVVERMWELYNEMSVEQKNKIGPNTVSNEAEIKTLLEKYNEEHTSFLNSNREDNTKLMDIYYKLKSYEPQFTREQMIIFKLGPVLPPVANSKSSTTEKSSIQEKANLKQYTYQIEKGEPMSPGAKVIHKKYEAFLLNNSADYVSWMQFNNETNLITYSVHPVNEKAPNNLRKLSVVHGDHEYISYMYLGKPYDRAKDELAQLNNESTLKKTGQNNTIKIIINKNGEYLMDGEYANIESFTKKIKGFTNEEKKKLIVNITAAEDAPVGDVNAVKTVLRTNNVIKVNFKIHHHGNSTLKSTSELITSQETVITDSDIPIANLDNYPIYPGCKGDKEAIKACFNKSLQTHIAKKFNADLAKNLDLSPGKKKVYAQIRITKTGKIETISSRAPHEALNEEMKRVINLYPKVAPGIYEGKVVNAISMIPITFHVD